MYGKGQVAVKSHGAKMYFEADFAWLGATGSPIFLRCDVCSGCLYCVAVFLELDGAKMHYEADARRDILIKYQVNNSWVLLPHHHLQYSSMAGLPSPFLTCSRNNKDNTIKPLKP